MLSFSLCLEPWSPGCFFAWRNQTMSLWSEGLSAVSHGLLFPQTSAGKLEVRQSVGLIWRLQHRHNYIVPTGSTCWGGRCWRIKSRSFAGCLVMVAEVTCVTLLFPASRSHWEHSPLTRWSVAAWANPANISKSLSSGVLSSLAVFSSGGNEICGGRARRGADLLTSSAGWFLSESGTRCSATACDDHLHLCSYAQQQLIVG